MATKKGLGRGLDALITASGDTGGEAQGAVLEIDINRIEPNRDQPRRTFDKDKLAELAESIKAYGVISPLVVRKEGGYYVIVAGERRWRAARLAGLRVLPVIIKEYNECETLEVALIENLQRTDLDPVEEAFSYKRLINDFMLTQEDIAARIGKSRSAVANSLRLLNLTEPVLELLRSGALSTGHAKVLLGAEGDGLREELAEKAVSGGMSVRELENAIKEQKESHKEQGVKIVKKAPAGTLYRSLETELTGALSAKTRIKQNRDGVSGSIEINYESQEDLDRLYVALRNIR